LAVPGVPRAPFLPRVRGSVGWTGGAAEVALVTPSSIPPRPFPGVLEGGASRERDDGSPRYRETPLQKRGGVGEL